MLLPGTTSLTGTSGDKSLPDLELSRHCYSQTPVAMATTGLTRDKGGSVKAVVRWKWLPRLGITHLSNCALAEDSAGKLYDLV